MHKNPTLLFGLAALLLIAIIVLPFLIKGKSIDSLPNGAYVHVTASEVMGPRESITLRFSAPMVESDQQQTTLDIKDAPFTLEPPIAGEGAWQNSQTFVFTPHATYTPATRYIINIKPGLRGLDGQEVSRELNFISMPLSIEGVQQTNWNEDGLFVVASFNLPVDPASLAEALRVEVFTVDGSSSPVDFQVLDDKASNYLTIQIPDPAEGTYYRLYFAPELASTVGPEPLNREAVYTLDPRQIVAIMDSNVQNRSADGSSRPQPVTLSEAQQDTGSDGTVTISIYASAPLDPDAVRPFLKISPDKVDKIIWNDSGYCLQISGKWTPGENVVIRLEAGMPAENGTTLEKAWQIVQTIPEISPYLSIDNSNSRMVMTPALGLRVPLVGVNIKNVSFSLWRLYDNNIPVEMANEYWDPAGFADRFSKFVGKLDVDLLEPRNQTFRKSVDLTDLVEDKNLRGLYLLRATGESMSPKDQDYWDYNQYAEQYILITDLAPVVMKRDSDLKVWVNNLSKGLPVPEADVIAYSLSNQVVAQGRTGADGVAVLKPAQSGKWESDPALVMVKTADDVTYLNLAGNLLDNAEFDIWGQTWTNLPYRAFCFTSRGVYRPGEHVDFKALFRDEQLLPPKPSPMMYRVFSPTGREMLRGTGQLSNEGGLVGGFDLPEAAPTGSYSLLVFAPGGETTVFGSVHFSVEEFVPPRIEVNLSADADKVIGEQELNLSLGADYLFGAPGSGLLYTLDRISRSAVFSHPDWKGVSFGDDSRFESSREQPLFDDVLSEQGEAGQVYTAGSGDLNAPSMVNWIFTLSVQEDGGRWVGKSLVLPYYPREEQLGLKLPVDYLAPGQPAVIGAVAVDTEGRPLDVSALEYTVERVAGHYNYVRQPNGSYRYDYSEEFIPLDKGEVVMSKGSGEFSFTPNRTGNYRVRITGPNGAAAAARVYAWSSYWRDENSDEDVESARLTVADITFDKSEYRIGEVAQITVRSPFQGRMLFNVETNRTLLTRTLDMRGEEVTLEVPVTAEFTPNAYCTAWIVKPVREEGKWSSHRAYGVAPLMVAKTDNLLDITLEAPDKALPDSRLPVSIKLTKPDGKPSSGEVCLYLVDEAILTLTNYQTPDPMYLFWAKQALGLSVKDYYDELTAPESKATPQLRPGGGDDGDGSDYLSAIRRNQIMLTIFVGKIDVPASGEADIELILPEFSGKGRLMAVAASGKLLGSTDRYVTIARDLVVEATGPRAVAPGDEFVVPVKAFMSAGVEHELRGEVKVTVSGPLQRADSEQLAVNITPGQSQAGPSRDFVIKAGPDTGLGIVTIESVLPGDPDNSYTQTVEIPVRSPFPKTTVSGAGVVNGNSELSLDIPDLWVPGTGALTVNAGGLPNKNLLPALNYLRNYPYGCLEQTVSAAWPFIVLPELLKDIDPVFLDQNNIDAGLAAAIKRISFMQLYDGSFAMWAGESRPALWASVYATHFLWAASSKTQLPEGLLESALEYLKQIMAIPTGAITPQSFDTTLSAKAYAAYVLTMAGQAPLAWLQQLNADKTLLTPSGRIYLAAALALHDKSSRPLRSLGELPELNWEGVNPTLESTPRNMAILLTAWSQVEPASQEAALLAKELLDTGLAGRWYTTQENAMGLMALARYYAANPDLNKPFSAQLASSAFDKPQPFSSEEDLALRVKSQPNAPLPLPLNLKIDGQGSAFYAWSSTGVPVEAPAPFAENLKVSLTLTDEQGQVLAWDGDEPLRLKQGARLNATLVIEPSTPVEQLIIVSVLPGGLEVDNPRLEELRDSEPAEDGPYTAYDYYGNTRLDLRDDRLILVCDYLNSRLAYTFTMRAVSKGAYIFPPVAGEGMYAPFIRSLSRHGTLIVE